MIELRWHGRAGQGAKTASTLLAQALLEEGRYVQAFPEYGPERSGAPMRAYTRIDGRRVRARYGVVEPDVAVVLDPSLVTEARVTDGLRPDGLLVLNAEARPAELPFAGRVVCVPAARLAQGGFVNAVMLGAVAAALGEPQLETLLEAARRKGLDPRPIADGHAAVKVFAWAA